MSCTELSLAGAITSDDGAATNKNNLRYVSITLSFPAPKCCKIDENASILNLLANFTLGNQFLK